jgi:hypothetical protein
VDTNDEEHETYSFGWWPEIFGALCVLALIIYLIAFARGTL